MKSITETRWTDEHHIQCACIGCLSCSKVGGRCQHARASFKKHPDAYLAGVCAFCSILDIAAVTPSDETQWADEHCIQCTCIGCSSCSKTGGRCQHARASYKKHSDVYLTGVCAFCSVLNNVAKDTMGNFEFLDAEICCRCSGCGYCKGSVSKCTKHHCLCHEPVSKKRRILGICSFCTQIQ